MQLISHKYVLLHLSKVVSSAANGCQCQMHTIWAALYKNDRLFSHRD